MRICSTYGRPHELSFRYDYEEVRMDVFDKVPDNVDSDTIITLCGRDASLIPSGFNGYVDNGTEIVHGFRSIRSYHDFKRTPDVCDIVNMFSKVQDIAKGAFTVRSFKDLSKLYEASQIIGKRHVLIGMGDMGTVTRLRSNILGNEFTFGYIGAPTAEGQLEADVLDDLGDDCTIVGIAGCNIQHNKFTAIQNAAIKKAKLNAIPLTFESKTSDRIGEVMVQYQIRGLNITIPYKTEIMSMLDECSEESIKIGAVNTIVNDDGKLKGYNTDCTGIMRAFAMSGYDLGNKRALVIGSGGAARASAYAMKSMGCDVHVLARNEVTLLELCDDLLVEPTSDPDVSGYDIIINCTPIGMIMDSIYPFDLNTMNGDQCVLDMVYNRKTRLIQVARTLGCKIISGSDVLVGQGAESFKLWFGMEPDYDAMRKAVGNE